MAHISVDLGGSGCKIFLGQLNQGIIETQLIHRFNNYLIEEKQQKYWDIEKILEEICVGVDLATNTEQNITSIGVDSWGVDFVLLDKNSQIIGKPVSYRDMRTLNVIDELDSLIKPYELYEKTGIQKQVFNTIYQLLYLKRFEPEVLDKAEHFLMIPDYINYVLTNEMFNEYTNATTTQLINAKSGNWDRDLIEDLGLPYRIFKKIIMPGTKIGYVKDEFCSQHNRPEVIAVASHDTASAVVAVPSLDEFPLYLSSGTWSLLGTEILTPNISKQSYTFNFTNEGGINYRFRLIKNIIGLWIIQNIKKECNDKFSFANLDKMASDSKSDLTINLDQDCFLSPKSMIDELKKEITNIIGPKDLSIGDLVKIVYNSLADLYLKTIGEIEMVTNNKYKELHILGGGSNAVYFNQLIRDKTNLHVILGPSEATSIGNLAVQMYAQRKFRNLREIRQSILKSGLTRRM